MVRQKPAHNHAAEVDGVKNEVDLFNQTWLDTATESIRWRIVIITVCLAARGDNFSGLAAQLSFDLIDICAEHTRDGRWLGDGSTLSGFSARSIRTEMMRRPAYSVQQLTFVQIFYVC